MYNKSLKKKYKKKNKKTVEMPGIEPGASHMRSERSTTELHPLYFTVQLISFKSMYCWQRF